MKTLQIMKTTLKYIITLSVLLLSINLMAQNNEIPASLVPAFKSGNANALLNDLNDNVELVIPTADNFFTKQQTKGILMDFFKKNPVKDFVVVHKGNKENAAFVIGTLITANGNFRVSVFARKSGAKSLVYQIRIENPNE